MISTLSISNFAIIDHVLIDFKEGMTVLSGETGAGKSIIIDAIGILAGGRGSADFIQEGADKFIIQGQFQLEPELQLQIQALVDNFGLSLNLSEEALLLHREINRSGNNAVRINGQLANVRLLKAIGDHLVDIHGQNEHQALLNVKEHIHLLDTLGDASFQALKRDYQIAYTHYKESLQAYQEAQKEEYDRQERLNFLNFQADEIEAMNLVEGEFEALDQQSKKLQHAQLIQNNLKGANELLSEGEGNAMEALQHVHALLEEIIPYQPALEEISQRLQESLYELEDIVQTLAYQESDEEEADGSLNEVERRLSELSSFKRKYQKDIDELIEYLAEISEEIYHIQHHDQYVESLKQALREAYESAHHLATELQEARLDLAIRLKCAIEAQLSDLYMKDARFQVRFTQPKRSEEMSNIQGEESWELTSQGLEQVEFYVATNVGEALKPLVQVASGGELSRLMLALKTAFSAQASGKTMIFDEIDTGVSGRVAEAIAHKIKENAHHQQVLCITHLPQVAAIADQQLLITKAVTAGRTHSELQELNLSQRKEVLAQMLAGEQLTPASYQMAEDLLKNYHPEGAEPDAR